MKILNRCVKFSKTSTLKINTEYVLSPKSLDYMLKYMAAHPVPKPEKFRSELLALLRHKTRPAGDASKIARILSALPNLKKDPELGTAAISKVAELLGLSEIPALNRNIVMRCEAYYKCNMLRCFMLKALTAVMSRTEALKYYGKYAEKRNSLYKFPKLKKVEEKLDLHNAAKKGSLKDGVCFVQAVTDDGRAVMKITRCRPAEVLLKAIKDPQLVHAVICQPDFAMAKLSNPAFELTRERSLVLGMPYCGHVWHDRRVHKKIEHPGRKFWKELN